MPLLGTAGSASARGFGFTALTSGPVGWVSYLGLSSPATGRILAGTGFYVDSASNIYLPYIDVGGTNTAIAKYDKTGTVQAYTRPFATDAVNPIFGATRYASAGVVPVKAISGVFSGTAPALWLNSSLVKGTTTPRSPTYSSWDGYINFTIPASVVDSTGKMSLAAYLVGGKGSQPGISLLSYDAAASTVSAKYTYGAGMGNTTVGIGIRTTNEVILVNKESTVLRWAIFDSSGTKTASYNVDTTSTDANDWPSVIIDSSNNMFVATYNGVVHKITSSNTYPYCKQFSSPNTSYPAQTPSISEYNGSVYLMWSRNTTNSGWYILCLSGSDLSVQWCNRFTITGASNYSQANGRASMKATADGIYMFLTDETYTQNYLMNIPLTGMPSSSSKVLAGSNKTLNWNISPTVVTTTKSVGSVTTWSMAISAGSSQVGSNYSAQTPSAPTAITKTQI